MTDSTTDRPSNETGGGPPETTGAIIPPETGATFPVAVGKRYQRWRILLGVAEWFAMVLLFGALAQFGWSVEIRQFAEGFTENPWLVVMIYLLPVGLLLTLVSAVLSAVRTFLLDRRFAMTTQRTGQWLGDEIKGAVVGAVLGLLVVELFYALIRHFPETWWIWASVAFSVLLIVFAHLAPVFIFPIFFRFRPITDDEIAGRLERLARDVGTRVKGVYEFNLSRKTRAANAALVGFGRTRRIVLADTLLDNFTLGEIEAVLAHEFGHHTLRHLPKAVLIQTVSLFFFFGCLGLILGRLDDPWPIWGLRGSTDVANFPLVVLTVMVLGLAMLPITNGLLRRFERQADDFALRTASRPWAFCSAFRRMAQLNLADPSPNPLIELIFHSHPSIGKRIAHAETTLRERGVPEDELEIPPSTES